MTSSSDPGDETPDSETALTLDPLTIVARITALEMLVRQVMVVQLKMLDKDGHIDLTPEYPLAGGSLCQHGGRGEDHRQQLR